MTYGRARGRLSTNQRIVYERWPFGNRDRRQRRLPRGADRAADLIRKSQLVQASARHQMGEPVSVVARRVGIHDCDPRCQRRCRRPIRESKRSIALRIAHQLRRGTDPLANAKDAAGLNEVPEFPAVPVLLPRSPGGSTGRRVAGAVLIGSAALTLFAPQLVEAAPTPRGDAASDSWLPDKARCASSACTGVSVYYPHPSARLNAAFTARPFQGTTPESATYLFVGLDANYNPTIVPALDCSMERRPL